MDVLNISMIVVCVFILSGSKLVIVFFLYTSPSTFLVFQLCLYISILTLVSCVSLLFLHLFQKNICDGVDIL